MILRELLHQAGGQLAAAGCDSPRLDAEVLWMHVSGHTRTDIILQALQPVDEAIRQAFAELVARRCQREPVAYILGKKEFWGLDFMVSPDVLVPRPETEHMLEWLLQEKPEREVEWLFADVGTGSGCLAVSMAVEYPRATIIASDLSLPALRVARRNAERHGVASRIRFLCADLLGAVVPRPVFDAVLSNPPYISAQAMQEVSADVRHEPLCALTDHGDGLMCMRTLLRQAAFQLKPGACLCVESGLAGYVDDPAPPMRLQHCYHDLAGQFRGVVYRRE